MLSALTVSALERHPVGCLLADPPDGDVRYELLLASAGNAPGATQLERWINAFVVLLEEYFGCAGMWVRILLAAAMAGSVAIEAQAQRNTDVPIGPGVWPPVQSPAPKTGSAPATKGASSPKDAGDVKGERPAGDTTGGTNKGNSSGRPK
jgi:hypothetical protein